MDIETALALARAARCSLEAALQATVDAATEILGSPALRLVVHDPATGATLAERGEGAGTGAPRLVVPLVDEAGARVGELRVGGPPEQSVEAERAAALERLAALAALAIRTAEELGRLRAAVPETRSLLHQLNNRLAALAVQGELLAEDHPSEEAELLVAVVREAAAIAGRLEDVTRGLVDGAGPTGVGRT
jgi:sugar phosphate isomerase/epimerase